MKITLSTIDNKYTLNFTGETSIVPSLYGATQVRTLGGRKKKRWRGKFNSISVSIKYITREQYALLEYIWGEYASEVMLKTENGGMYIGIMSDDTLTFATQYKADGTEFLTGTINIEE